MGAGPSNEGGGGDDGGEAGNAAPAAAPAGGQNRPPAGREAPRQRRARPTAEGAEAAGPAQPAGVPAPPPAPPPPARANGGGGGGGDGATQAAAAAAGGPNGQRGPTTQETHVTTLASHLSLTKSTLKLEPVVDEKSDDDSSANDDEDAPASEPPTHYMVKFNFDASVDGIISIFFMARPVQVERNARTFVSTLDTVIPSQAFTRGMRQTFIQSEAFALDLGSVDTAELTKETGLTCYPLVITLETMPQHGSSSESEEEDDIMKKGEYQCQTTYCTFTKSGDKYGLKVLKQVAKINDCSYMLYEIFGITGGDTDGMSECVVCMAEARDTTVLPCRHNCLCHECARELRQRSNRCPICRVPFQSLLQFKVQKKRKKKGKSRKGERKSGKKKAGSSSSSDTPRSAASSESDSGL